MANNFLVGARYLFFGGCLIGVANNLFSKYEGTSYSLGEGLIEDLGYYITANFQK